MELDNMDVLKDKMNRILNDEYADMDLRDFATYFGGGDMLSVLESAKLIGTRKAKALEVKRHIAAIEQLLGELV